jgi:hypothetical protein
VHLSKALNVERNGQLDGSNNSPSSSSLTKSLTEEKIIKRTRDHYNKVLEKVLRREADELEEIFDDVKELRQRNGYSNMIQDMENNINNTFDKIDKDSKRAAKDIIEKFKELEIFKKRHKRIEFPIVKDASDTQKAVLLLFFLAGFEILMNTLLLKDALRGSISTTLMLVIAISMVNILGSFMYGKLALTNFNHIRQSRKIFASIASVIFLPLLVHFNIAMGVFRGIAEKATMAFDLEAMSEAGSKAIWPYDNFSDLTLEGGLLSIAGLIFAIISTYDGYTFDDPYPGYGRLGKEYNKVKNKLRIIEDIAYSEYDNQQKLETESIENLQGRRNGANNTWRKSVNELQSLYDDYDDWVQTLNDDANHLIAQYQQSNSMMRKTSNPEYFGDENSLGFKNSEKFFDTMAENYMDDELKIRDYEEMNNVISAEHSVAKRKVTELYSQSKLKLKENFKEIYNEVRRETHA